jgi:hypothetical protein
LKDAEVRGLILQKMYEIRHERHHLTLPDELGLAGFDMNDVWVLRMLGNIGKQLSDKGLIEMHPVINNQYNTGRAWITAHGVDVVEETVASPITVIFDHSTNIHGSSNVQIGQGHSQNWKKSD